MYQQRHYIPELMMLDLQQDLADELGMSPDLELMQLEEMEPMNEDTDAEMEELDDGDQYLNSAWANSNNLKNQL